MKALFTKSILFLLLMTVIINRNVLAQDKKNSDPELIAKIVELDSLVFDAFNKRDIERFKSYFNTDLEFYHDKGGLTGYDHTVDFLKSLAQNKSTVKRVLDKESLEVFPVPGYGAMQIGAHLFCQTENGKENCSRYRFVHVWQNREGQWKISRVISYDH